MRGVYAQDVRRSGKFLEHVIAAPESGIGHSGELSLITCTINNITISRMYGHRRQAVLWLCLAIRSHRQQDCQFQLEICSGKARAN